MDRFTRRGFVGALAVGAASALWLPRARADRVALRSRWDARADDDNLTITLFVSVDAAEHVEVPTRAIELHATLHDPRRGERVVELERFERREMMTRSGRRLDRNVFVGREDVAYETFSAPMRGGVRDGTRVQLHTVLRGSLDAHPERARRWIAALADLRATVPVRQT